MIFKIWKPPTPGPLPDSVTIKFKWPHLHKVTLTSEKLVVSDKRQEREYTWREVSQAVIWRLDERRTDFRELHLHLTDQEIVFRRGEDVMNWSGATADVLCAMVARYADADHTKDFVLSGPSRSTEEVDARISRLRPRVAEMHKAQWLLPLVFMAPLVMIQVFMIPWPKNVIMAALYFPLIYVMHRIFRDGAVKLDQEIWDLESERGALSL